MSYITADKAIVLDTGGAIGAIVTSAPGQQSLKVTIKGKPAHAGSCSRRRYQCANSCL